MKIVYLSGAALPSRTANSIHIMKMCQAFAEYGHDVVLFAQVVEKRITDQKIFAYYGIKHKFRIKRLLKSNIQYFGHMVGLLMALQAMLLKPDLAIGRHPTGCFFSSLLGINTIFEIHGPVKESGRLTHMLFKQMIKLSSFKRLILITHSLKTYYEIEYPDLKDKISVLPDGSDIIDMESVAPAGIRINNMFNVGYTGHLYKGKGMELIAELVPRCPFAHFHIVGGKNEDIRYWKKQINGAPNISFHGFKPHSQIPSYLKDFDAVLLPNQKEVRGNAGKNIGQWTSPLKLFEYMAAGKAIISSDLPVFQEVLEHGRNALLCPPDNVDAWANCLRRLNEDPLMKESLGKEAKKDLNRYYTWRARAERVINHTERTIGQ